MNSEKWSSVTILRSIKKKIEAQIANNPDTDFTSLNNFIQIAILKKLDEIKNEKLSENKKTGAVNSGQDPKSPPTTIGGST